MISFIFTGLNEILYIYIYICVCVYIYIYMCVCVCVCVCVHLNICVIVVNHLFSSASKSPSLYIYIYIYIYIRRSTKKFIGWQYTPMKCDQMRLIFQHSLPWVPNPNSIGVSMLGSHLSKNHQQQIWGDHINFLTSEFFSPPAPHSITLSHSLSLSLYIYI